MAPKKTTRKPVDYSDPLYIGNEMAAMDKKDRDYYDNLTDEQKKKFSPFLMLKWGPSVLGDTDLQAYYLMAFNQNVNKNFWTLSKHPKLQWLSMTASSPGIGKQKHYWVTATNKQNTDKLEKKLSEIFPDSKLQDIKTLMQVKTKEEILEWLYLQCGIEQEELKKLM
jgi:hypothetical protein